MGLEDALSLVVLRGALMAEAAERQGDGGMLAILKGTLADALELAGTHRVVLANDNAPGQTILSGPSAALDAVAADARERGLRAMRLDVAGAFHSPAMASACQPLLDVLGRVALSPPRAPVYSGMTAAPFRDLRAELAQALVRPVRWRETMLALHAAGARRFVDVGPDRVLARLVARNLSGVEAWRSSTGPRRWPMASALEPHRASVTQARDGEPTRGARRARARQRRCPRRSSATICSLPRSAWATEWIVRRTGIVERRHAAAGAQLSELAAAAGAEALADAGLDASERRPGDRRDVHARLIIPPRLAASPHVLGAGARSSFDLNAACTGFVARARRAPARQIGRRSRGNALVIGAEMISRHLDPDDRKTAAVFGDGAGALVIGGTRRAASAPFVMRRRRLAAPT